MKYLKLFESMTDMEVAKICKKYVIENWSINKDGLVDVDGDVSFLSFLITRQHAAEFPLQFGSVTGDFLCFSNKLTTLEGAPQEVGGDFYCYNNNLTTLEGGPKEVGGDFYCKNNNLTTLKWTPEYVGGASFLPNLNLPIEFLEFLELNNNRNDLQTYILKWQKDYAVWRKDGSFNQSNFIQMMEAAQDEIQNIKFS